MCPRRIVSVWQSPAYECAPTADVVQVSVRLDIDAPTAAAWTEILNALPSPAALLDESGQILVAGRWLYLEEGAQLVAMEASSDRIAPGIDGNSHWRIQQVRDDTPIYLATIERLSPSEHLLRRFHSDSDKLYGICDRDAKFIEWNAAWTEMLGYENRDLLGTLLWDLVQPPDTDKRPEVEAELRRSGRVEVLVRMRKADGSSAAVKWMLLFDAKTGRCFGVGELVNDAADQIRAVTAASLELRRRAYTDELTGLASRSRVVEELDKYLSATDRPALLFCDLDQFKIVNDSLGHAVGDRLLASLGQRLSAAMASDNVLIGRFGGDEFAVVIPSGGLEAAHGIAAKVFAAVSEGFSVVGRSVTVGVSIGLCVADETATSAEIMLERADMAVYQAKEKGRNRIEVYGPELQRQVDRRFELEEALRRGLERNEFEPWFQPIMGIRNTNVVGLEALLRWRRPEGHILVPSSFHDVAIETGLISPIGRLMISRALGEFATIAGKSDIWLTLNVSARELSDGSFARWFVEEVAHHGLRPSQVILEITESIAIEEHELSDHLSFLRAMGFRIALDDFGTGHSSLAHLRTLPIDMVKIDRSFVADLVQDHTTGALTRSVVDLCAALGLLVVFEGVETTAESLAVVASGGEYAQGYLFSRPMPMHELQWRTVGSELSRRLAARDAQRREAEQARRIGAFEFADQDDTAEGHNSTAGPDNESDALGEAVERDYLDDDSEAIGEPSADAVDTAEFAMAEQSATGSSAHDSR